MLKKFEKSGLYYALILVSILYIMLGMYAFWGLENNQETVNSFTSWSNLTLNEKGDTFAGFVTPLVLFWAIGSVLIQRQELKENRTIFEAQYLETKKNAVSDLLNNIRPSLDKKAEYLILKASKKNTPTNTELLNSLNGCEKATYLLGKQNWDELSIGEQSYMRSLIDACCEYSLPFWDIQEQHENNEQLIEYIDWYLKHTEIGRLYNKCNYILKKTDDYLKKDGGYSWLRKRDCKDSTYIWERR
ncbi:hypothetical protein [Curvivirga aplysinae]|uniref:hypothetical protein n=1 Tax=Curvivirga aplysinae TaxID=2529852 RepID=UPI0012BCECDF|nr:hypothetical protein [Curvivirga aplysinae]MTI11198.1 hypothetical protein [Curvivirga aplysinae]